MGYFGSTHYDLMRGAICHLATLRERYLRSEEKMIKAQEEALQAQERFPDRNAPQTLKLTASFRNWE
jgi:glutamate racemase